MPRRTGLIVTFFVSSFAAVLWAQTSPVIRIRGTITAYEGNMLTVKSNDGDSEKIALSGDLVVTPMLKASLADIKPGLFVGTAALPQSDGTLKAMEVHIFPEAMRGSGEGHRDFDLAPESTMTNAAISDAVSSVSGETITLKYKGGEKKVVVGKDTPIVFFGSGTAADVKPGLAVIVFVQKAPDGSLKSSRLAIEKDGVKPPM
jgi:uncharacterized protein Veg